ncbi:helix-turn-helix domain-containing protein [Diaphorobacter sp. HDW4A]|uniref:helix-turn-helix domain-containing protein n=1 Tax=Diaphorobacter sp. HDW4A TaxID=2714924 RepID=UPI00140D9220|nr:helix-turn-helix transcriptional regulator [Diaphorobacter sp. HDW4A]QIL80241.1 helix-turn-helix domain-containing protein [Diaphorobacter sp. HDW4A]
MPNIAALLKSEISRVARKEVRAETDSLRKLLSAQRSAIAALKREIAELRKESKRPAAPRKALQADMEAPQPDEVKRRFSAKRLAAHRQKTGLSAADYGALVGVSGQSVYHYEQGKARPHAAVVRKLSMIKELGKTQILALLGEQKAESNG